MGSIALMEVKRYLFMEGRPAFYPFFLLSNLPHQLPYSYFIHPFIRH